jgi:signal transduction histidine kinase
MEQLISDVLNYSSVSADDSVKVDVNTDILVRDLIQILYVPEHVSISIENKLPIVKGDKTKLPQLFQNLISNAVKFIDKPVGAIKIDVKSYFGHYEFSINDNGMGIEKKYHDKIFKIFHSLHKSKDSSGIGLSIVKKIVDLHEGEIWLESEPNIGTTFYFTIKR